MNNKLKIGICSLIIVLLIMLFYPYFKAEVLTLKYGDEFINEYRQTNMIDEIEYMKIIEYKNNYAKVFYVTKNHETGDVIEFKKENNRWQYVYWNTVWSKKGSASGFIWPYYR